MSWLALLAKLTLHADKIDDIVEAIDAVRNADSSATYWAAIKRLGDLLQPIVETVTGFEVVDEESAVEAMKLGDGKLIGRIGDFVNSPLGQLLLNLLLKQVAG